MKQVNLLISITLVAMGGVYDAADVLEPARATIHAERSEDHPSHDNH